MPNNFHNFFNIMNNNICSIIVIAQYNRVLSTFDLKIRQMNFLIYFSTSSQDPLLDFFHPRKKIPGNNCEEISESLQK